MSRLPIDSICNSCQTTLQIFGLTQPPPSSFSLSFFLSLFQSPNIYILYLFSSPNNIFLNLFSVCQRVRTQSSMHVTQGGFRTKDSSPTVFSPLYPSRSIFLINSPCYYVAGTGIEVQIITTHQRDLKHIGINRLQTHV